MYEKILIDVCLGKSNKEIARDHGVAPTTIKHRVNQLFIKHEAETRSELICNVLIDGVVTVPELRAAREKEWAKNGY